MRGERVNMPAQIRGSDPKRAYVFVDAVLKPLQRWRLSMVFFTGSHRAGLLTILTALLLPVLGFGVASAVNVGDTVNLQIPDLQEFPEDPATHQFTCRAVTEHAYWLVQDTVSCDKKGGSISTDSLCWGVTFTQGELDTLTSEFEGGGIDVWETVTGVMGVPVDTDGDPKIWIVLATIPTKYNSSQTSQSPRNNMVHVDVQDLNGEFNAHDIFYLNLHTFATTGSTLPKAKAMRRIYMANGLAILSRLSQNQLEEQWLYRGLGSIAQYLCFGFTESEYSNDLSHEWILSQFRLSPYIELTNALASNQKGNWAGSRGQQYLWLMYLMQREGEDIIHDIATSDSTGMMNVALAIDPSVVDTLAIQTNVVPIYNDWIICNLVSAYRDDMSGGIYTYAFLAGSEYQFGHIGSGAAFAHTFNSYPLDELWIAPAGSGLQAPIWAIQYCAFNSGYSGSPMIYFNGMFSDGGGSGSVINSAWDAWVVSVDTLAEELHSVSPVALNDVYNGSFTLAGDEAYLVVTNNLQGGISDARYVLSQDTNVPDVLLSAHQNSINDQYITLYTTLYEAVPEGFDWYGPIFTATHGDSTGTFDMSPFYGTLWDVRFSAWDAGAFTLTVAGYDSTGLTATNSLAASVGWASTGGLRLEVTDIRLDIPGGSVAPGTMVTMCEADMLGLAIETQTSIESVAGQMTGVLAGPVSMPDAAGTLSFPAGSSDGAVYRYTAEGWERLDSWFQGGRMMASVNDGGIYVYGEGPGVASPVIPADFRFNGTYPNPFSSEAAISFSLPINGRVSVTVFDMSGRIVRVLNDTELQAAEHTLVWDGTDTAGHPVGAGVYFCRLEAAGQTVTQKMLRIE